MKFVLAAYGSRGDVEPFAAVGRELLRRGHDVCIAVPPKMIGFAESVGLAAVAFGSDPPWQGDEEFVRADIANPLVRTMTDITQEISKALAEWGETLLTLADGADLLLTGRGEQGLAANVAEYYDIPLATLHFFPDVQSTLRGVLGGITKDAEDAQRRALGLPEATGALPEPLQIQAYDGLCFPELAAEWAQQGGHRPFVGALTLELPTDADDAALSWIAEGTPPIYFGFGSNIPLPSPPETVAVISAACARLGERALICSGASDFSGVAHFDNVKVVGAVNHATVLPACRAVVHHGGAGTTAAGLRAGIPALVLSFWIDDQAIWASAIEQLKVGAARAFSASTLDSLVADLHSILTPEYIARAREVADQMITVVESVSNTADLLEGAAQHGASDDR